MRNIVNQEEIKSYLSLIKEKYKNDLLNHFIDTSIFNYIIKQAPLRENSGFVADFPGPYHEAVISKEIKEKILSLCDETFLKIHKGEIDSTLKLSSLAIESDVSWVCFFKGYNGFKVNTAKGITQVGESFANCLRDYSRTSLDLSRYSLFFVRDESGKAMFVACCKYNEIVEIKKPRNEYLSASERDLFLEMFPELVVPTVRTSTRPQPQELVMDEAKMVSWGMGGAVLLNLYYLVFSNYSEYVIFLLIGLMLGSFLVFMFVKDYLDSPKWISFFDKHQTLRKLFFK